MIDRGQFEILDVKGKYSYGFPGVIIMLYGLFVIAIDPLLDWAILFVVYLNWELEVYLGKNEN